MLTPEPVGPRCGKHPEVAAVAPCTRCGTFVCGPCTEVLGEAAYCADCVTWLRHNGPPSRVVKGLIGLSIVALLSAPLLCFLPVLNVLAAALGLWLPTRELDRIRRGEGPLRGLRQARVARWLAGANLLLTLLWIAGFLYAWRHNAVE
jgi:hypothetical protein